MRAATREDRLWGFGKVSTLRSRQLSMVYPPLFPQKNARLHLEAGTIFRLAMR